MGGGGDTDCMCGNESGRVRLQEVEEINQVDNMKCEESTGKGWKKCERGAEEASASSLERVEKNGRCDRRARMKGRW